MTKLPFWTVFVAFTALGACSQDHLTVSTKGAVDIQATPPGQATCFAASSRQNQSGVAATNAVRSRAGLLPVKPNAALARAAASHACDMAMRGRMTHRGSTSTGPGSRVRAMGYLPRLTAENIAAGPIEQAGVLKAWEESEGHLSNIMLPQVTDYGIGQALAADGQTRFWAAVYAAPLQ